MTRKLKQTKLIFCFMLTCQIFLGQQNNTFDQELYNFMQMATGNLNMAFGLSNFSDTSCFYKLNQDFPRAFIADTTKLNSKMDSLLFGQINPDVSVSSEPEKLLLEKDIQSFLTSKKKAPFGKWDKNILRFSKKNKKDWYSLSVPIFNYDHSKAIVIIRYSCNQFMCGNGDIILFVQHHGHWWTHVNLRHWDN
jgi:hypothetical protein